MEGRGEEKRRGRGGGTSNRANDPIGARTRTRSEAGNVNTLSAFATKSWHALIKCGEGVRCVV